MKSTWLLLFPFKTIANVIFVCLMHFTFFTQTLKFHKVNFNCICYAPELFSFIDDSLECKANNFIRQVKHSYFQLSNQQNKTIFIFKHRKLYRNQRYRNQIDFSHDLMDFRYFNIILFKILFFPNGIFYISFDFKCFYCWNIVLHQVSWLISSKDWKIICHKKLFVWNLCW